MRLVVTGGTGFIGRHVVPQLIERGHRVTLLGHDESKLQSFAWGKQAEFVPFHIGDATHDLQYRLAKPDALIHLAWPGLPNYTKPFHVEEALPAHYEFLRSMIELGVGQVLVAGTCLEYGLQNGRIAETVAPVPTTSYGIAKDSLRRRLGALQLQHPYVLQWARLFYVYGPGQHSGSLLAQLDRAIADGKATFEMSSGEQLRDYLPVEEVAARLARLVECASCQGEINICNGEPISVRRLVEEHLQRKGRKIELRLGTLPYSDFEPSAFWGDGRKFAECCAHA